MNLTLTATTTTPGVSFDAENNRYIIQGKSTMVDSLPFYQQMIEWIKQHHTAINQESVFRFELTYFNSSSHKGIYLFLTELKKIQDDVGAFRIEWVTDDDDDFMQEAGETYQEVTDLTFTYVTA